MLVFGLWSRPYPYADSYLIGCDFLGLQGHPFICGEVTMYHYLHRELSDQRRAFYCNLHYACLAVQILWSIFRWQFVHHVHGFVIV